MDIILAAFTSAAFSARTIAIITVTGNYGRKKAKPPGLKPGGLFIRTSRL
jgi:hypothetical protein